MEREIIHSRHTGLSGSSFVVISICLRKSTTYVRLFLRDIHRYSASNLWKFLVAVVWWYTKFYHFRAFRKSSKIVTLESIRPFGIGLSWFAWVYCNVSDVLAPHTIHFVHLIVGSNLPLCQLEGLHQPRLKSPREDLLGMAFRMSTKLVIPLGIIGSSRSEWFLMHFSPCRSVIQISSQHLDDPWYHGSTLPRFPVPVLGTKLRCSKGSADACRTTKILHSAPVGCQSLFTTFLLVPNSCWHQ